MICNDKKASQVEGAEQALRLVYSGVRVRIQATDSICIAASQQPDDDHFGVVPAAFSKNGRKTSVTITNTHQNIAFTSPHTKLIDRHSSFECLLPLRSHSKDDCMISIGIQTAIISKTDQQTSCNIVELVPGSDKAQSFSPLSSSETSVSVVSHTISDTKKDKSRQDRNHQNNNATNNDTTRIDQQIQSEEVSAEKDSALPLQDVLINRQCYFPSAFSRVVSTGTNRFLDPLRNLLAVFRSPFVQRDRPCAKTDDMAMPINTNQYSNEGSRVIHVPPSRCRRSTVKHCVDPFVIQTNESYLEELEHSAPPEAVDSGQTTSERHLTVNTLPSTEQPHRLKSHSSFSKNGLHANQWRRNTHLRNHTRRRSNKRKTRPVCHFRVSDLSPAAEMKLSPSIDCPSKISVDKDFSSTHADNLIPKRPVEPDDLLPSLHRRLHECNEYSLDRVRLRVKHKNLIFPFMKAKIPTSYDAGVDESIYEHQKKVVNELKLLLQQKRRLHFNNNGLDGHASSSVLHQLHAQSAQNNNDNKERQTSTASTDSQSSSTEQSSERSQQFLSGQNTIVREGVDQLKRYQRFAERYQLQSNEANEPHQARKSD